MHKDFLNHNSYKNADEISIVLKNPPLKFKYKKILIRSIDDTAYPQNTLLEIDHTGYFGGNIFDFYHNGLIVFTYPGWVYITIRDEGQDCKIKVATLGYIPFVNIIDYDIDGDEFYNHPHLFCDFTNRTDPFEKIGYVYHDDKNGYDIINDDIIIDHSCK